jgi:hypothetical protein
VKRAIGGLNVPIRACASRRLLTIPIGTIGGLSLPVRPSASRRLLAIPVGAIGGLSVAIGACAGCGLLSGKRCLAKTQDCEA